MCGCIQLHIGPHWCHQSKRGALAHIAWLKLEECKFSFSLGPSDTLFSQQKWTPVWLARGLSVGVHAQLLAGPHDIGERGSWLKTTFFATGSRQKHRSSQGWRGGAVERQSHYPVRLLDVKLVSKLSRTLGTIDSAWEWAERWVCHYVKSPCCLMRDAHSWILRTLPWWKTQSTACFCGGVTSECCLHRRVAEWGGRSAPLSALLRPQGRGGFCWYLALV